MATYYCLHMNRKGEFTFDDDVPPRPLFRNPETSAVYRIDDLGGDAVSVGDNGDPHADDGVPIAQPEDRLQAFMDYGASSRVDLQEARATLIPEPELLASGSDPNRLDNVLARAREGGIVFRKKTKEIQALLKLISSDSTGATKSQTSSKRGPKPGNKAFLTNHGLERVFIARKQLRVRNDGEKAKYGELEEKIVSYCQGDYGQESNGLSGPQKILYKAMFQEVTGRNRETGMRKLLPDHLLVMAQLACQLDMDAKEDNPDAYPVFARDFARYLIFVIFDLGEHKISKRYRTLLKEMNLPQPEGNPKDDTWATRTFAMCSFIGAIIDKGPLMQHVVDMAVDKAIATSPAKPNRGGDYPPGVLPKNFHRWLENSYAADDFAGLQGTLTPIMAEVHEFTTIQVPSERHGSVRLTLKPCDELRVKDGDKYYTARESDNQFVTAHESVEEINNLVPCGATNGHDKDVPLLAAASSETITSVEAEDTKATDDGDSQFLHSIEGLLARRRNGEFDDPTLMCQLQMLLEDGCTPSHKENRGFGSAIDGLTVTPRGFEHSILYAEKRADCPKQVSKYLRDHVVFPSRVKKSSADEDVGGASSQMFGILLLFISLDYPSDRCCRCYG